MATPQELEQLTQHIRKSLSRQQFLTDVRPDEAAGSVRLCLHSRKFVVKPTLEVFELKGNSPVITGSSRLVEATLRRADLNEKVVGPIVETMQTAEDSLRADPEKAFALLGEVKKSLLKLAGKRTPASPDG